MSFSICFSMSAMRRSFSAMLLSRMWIKACSDISSLSSSLQWCGSCQSQPMTISGRLPSPAYRLHLTNRMCTLSSTCVLSLVTVTGKGDPVAQCKRQRQQDCILTNTAPFPATAICMGLQKCSVHLTQGRSDGNRVPLSLCTTSPCTRFRHQTHTHTHIQMDSCDHHWSLGSY